MKDTEKKEPVSDNRYRISYSYTGSKELFYIRPTTFDLNHPIENIDMNQNKVWFEFTYNGLDKVELQKETDKHFENCFHLIGNINNDIKNINNKLNQQIPILVSERNEYVTKKSNFLSEINKKENI